MHKRCADGISSSNNEAIYNVVKLVSEIDTYSAWEKDLLFGHMRILLENENKKPFPGFWNTEKEKVSQHEKNI